MNKEMISLSNLHDITVPDAPGLWTLASGAWLVLGMVLLTTLIVFFHLYRAWRRNAYRRAGLTLLSSATSNHEVSVVLKRVALAVFPREQVASLHGRDWAAFLNASCPRCDFQAISVADFGAKVDQQYMAMALTWIRHHRLPPPSSMRAEAT